MVADDIMNKQLREREREKQGLGGLYGVKRERGKEGGTSKV